MYLLGEPLDKVRAFQTHVARLAMKTDMWAARCRMIHPGGTTGISSRKAAAGKYAATLEHRKRKDLPVAKRVYMGLPTRRRKTMMQQWGIAFPTPAEAPLYSWVTRTPGPAKHTQKERRVKRKDGETAQKTVTPAVISGPVRALCVIESFSLT